MQVQFHCDFLKIYLNLNLRVSLLWQLHLFLTLNNLNTFLIIVGIYYSRDGGRSWNMSDGGYPKANWYNSIASSSSGQVVVTGTLNDGNSNLYSYVMLFPIKTKKIWWSCGTDLKYMKSSIYTNLIYRYSYFFICTHKGQLWVSINYGISFSLGVYYGWNQCFHYGQLAISSDGTKVIAGVNNLGRQFYKLIL